MPVEGYRATITDGCAGDAPNRCTGSSTCAGSEQNVRCAYQEGQWQEWMGGTGSGAPGTGTGTHHVTATPPVGTSAVCAEWDGSGNLVEAGSGQACGAGGGSGDVTGPSSATVNRLSVFANANGKVIDQLGLVMEGPDLDENERQTFRWKALNHSGADHDVYLRQAWGCGPGINLTNTFDGVTSDCTVLMTFNRTENDNHGVAEMPSVRCGGWEMSYAKASATDYGIWFEDNCDIYTPDVTLTVTGPSGTPPVGDVRTSRVSVWRGTDWIANNHVPTTWAAGGGDLNASYYLNHELPGHAVGDLVRGHHSVALTNATGLTTAPGETPRDFGYAVVPGGCGGANPANAVAHVMFISSNATPSVEPTSGQLTYHRGPASGQTGRPAQAGDCLLQIPNNARQAEVTGTPTWDYEATLSGSVSWNAPSSFRSFISYVRQDQNEASFTWSVDKDDATALFRILKHGAGRGSAVVIDNNDQINTTRGGKPTKFVVYDSSDNDPRTKGMELNGFLGWRNAAGNYAWIETDTTGQSANTEQKIQVLDDGIIPVYRSTPAPTNGQVLEFDSTLGPNGAFKPVDQSGGGSGSDKELFCAQPRVTSSTGQPDGDVGYWWNLSPGVQWSTWATMNDDRNGRKFLPSGGTVTGFTIVQHAASGSRACQARLYYGDTLADRFPATPAGASRGATVISTLQFNNGTVGTPNTCDEGDADGIMNANDSYCRDAVSQAVPAGGWIGVEVSPNAAGTACDTLQGLQVCVQVQLN